MAAETRCTSSGGLKSGGSGSISTKGPPAAQPSTAADVPQIVGNQGVAGKIHAGDAAEHQAEPPDQAVAPVGPPAPAARALARLGRARCEPSDHERRARGRDRT